MTSEPFNFEQYQHPEGGDGVVLPELPSGVSEADLLDLVEGRLHGERRARVEAALAAAPALVKLMRGMAADRAALVKVGREFTPAQPSRSLVETSIQRAQRELAAEVATAGERWALNEYVQEPETDFIPVSRVMPVTRHGSLRRWLEGAGGRGLAMAAGLVLAVGAGVWGIVAIGSAIWPDAAAPRQLAQDDPTYRPLDTDEPAPGVVGGDGEVTHIATLSPALERSGAVITLTADSPFVKKIEPARALAAADAGTLVLKVWALPGKSYDAALRCDALAGEQARRATGGAGLPKWGVGYDDVAQLPRDYAALAASTFSSRMSTATAWGVRRVYLVEVEATPTALASFLSEMERVQGDIGMGGARASGSDVLGVNYVEAQTPIMLKPQADIPATPVAEEALKKQMSEQLFWWNAPADRWARRVIVPVVIESVE